MSDLDPPTRYLMKRRRLRRIGDALIAVLLICSLADQFGLFGSDVDDWDRFDRTSWIVVRIINGDTLELKDDSERTLRVRLLGVDAPDLGAHWSDRAMKYASARALNQRVTLALDGTQTRDDMGDLLGYVYLSDIESLNLALIRDGQAYADRRSRYTFHRVFEQAENMVRKKGTGLWKDLPFEQMPLWRQRWLKELTVARGADDSKIGKD